MLNNCAECAWEIDESISTECVWENDLARYFKKLLMLCYVFITYIINIIMKTLNENRFTYLPLRTIGACVSWWIWQAMSYQIHWINKRNFQNSFWWLQGEVFKKEIYPLFIKKVSINHVLTNLIDDKICQKSLMITWPFNYFYDNPVVSKSYRINPSKHSSWSRRLENVLNKLLTG